MGAAEPVDEQSRLSAPGATVVLPGTDSEVHMYDDSWDPPLPPDYWAEQRWAGPPLPEVRSRGADRLMHLVFLDGRLVDCWKESPFGTEYTHLAEQNDDDALRLTRALDPRPAPKPVHETTLVWLEALAGGRAALMAMTHGALPEAPLPVSHDAPAADRQRLELLWRRLAPMSDLFGDEALQAARALVVFLWQEDRTAMTVPPTDRVLAGIVWVVARANDLFARAAVTHAIVREAIDISVPLTTHGQAMHRVLGGLPASVGSPEHQPDLLAVGRPELLTSATRRRLARLRDQALEVAMPATPGVVPETSPSVA